MPCGENLVRIIIYPNVKCPFAFPGRWEMQRLSIILSTYSIGSRNLF
jgi:hypothetical protein